MEKFLTRPFKIPDAVLDEIASAPAGMTAVLHRHAGNLGDYEAVKGWYRRLSTEFNWVGATLMFNVVRDYHLREKTGDLRYRQTMMEREDGKSVGYIRFLHLSRDTATRRQDCTKVEETIIADVADIKNPDFFRAMYDHAAAEGKKLGRARLLTELGVGLSPRKFMTFAGTIQRFSGTNDSEKMLKLQRAKSLFYRDWTGVTERFIRHIGFEPTDIIIPEDPLSESTTQLRISRNIGNVQPLPLPPYTAENRHCVQYQGNLGILDDAIKSMRSRAAEKYGLTLSAFY